MNYMDYVNDACMWMLSEDQADAMTAYWAVTAGDLNTDVITTDYSLNFTTDELNLCEGSPMVYTFDYDADASFSTQVDFTYTVVPAGPVVTFSQSSATVDTTGITATVTGATAGNYTITVTGTYGTEVQNYNLALNVFSATLVSPALTAPANASTGVAPATTLTWVAQANAQDYTVAVYTDAGLTTLYQPAATVTGASYDLSGLSALTSYWWTVTPNNLCVTPGPISTTYMFTTADVSCETNTNNTAVVISASGADAEYTSVINVTTGIVITDVNVTINISHTWDRDIAAIITSPNGTEVELVRNEGPGGGPGFTNTTFDQEATNPIAGSTATPFTGSFVPEGDLSTIYGEASLGDWTLKIIDLFDGDGGSLDSWSLELCGSPIPDSDNDGVYDMDDNCIYTANPGQEDMDGDSIGDVCDDSDGDGVFDDVDNCPTVANPTQADANANGIGDVCEDSDGDGVFDDVDNCINIANAGQEDWNSDGEGDVCDDSDADGIFDDVDNCVSIANAGQEDMNSDGEGDVCDDTDADGVMDDMDNCPTVANPGQEDADSDGTGDVCQDTDNDGVFDTVDNCVNTANPGQEDWNSDGEGDACDDSDADGIFDDVDNCVTTANADQADWNSDGEGDVCDNSDGDSHMDSDDNCPSTDNEDQADAEGDGIGDACQVYDADGDGVLDNVDNCVNTANPGQEDADGNGVGDACQDTDLDTILDINDNCPSVANTDQADVDGNGIGNVCQDTDGDGVLDIDDNCPLTSNPGQEDVNNDGIGDVCESVEPADTLTPNGDLQNDTWNIKNIENVSNTVKVFNRHGVKVFDASNYVNNTWGGESTEGGSGLLPAGSYYYVIEYTSTQGEAKVSKGWMYINY